MLRRGLILTGIGLAAASPLRAAERLATAPQMEGPFYPYKKPRVQDADLVRLRAGDAPAVGPVVHVLGTAQTFAGEPIADALVEIWQCDSNGRYVHPDDHEDRPRDPRFQGYGKTLTDRQGKFKFRTIRPVSYAVTRPAEAGGNLVRTPHIHLTLSTRGVRRLTTQLYVAGEPLNETDIALAEILPAQRAGLIRPFTNGASLEPGAQMVQYDLVVV
jgi:protocatechuate 3,4-dioxygenase, beta subunit